MFALVAVALHAATLVLAQGALRSGLLTRLLAWASRFPRGRGRATLLLLMLGAAGLSWFVPSSALVALVAGGLRPVRRALPGLDVRRAFVLGPFVAAVIGALATPVASPVAAVVWGALGRAGHRMTFLQWTTVMAPVVLVLVLLAWGHLCLRFVPARTRVVGWGEPGHALTRAELAVAIVGVATVAAWCLPYLHGWPSVLVAVASTTILLLLGCPPLAALRGRWWASSGLVVLALAVGEGLWRTGVVGWVAARIDGGPALLVAVALGTWGLANLVPRAFVAGLAAPLALAVGDVAWLGPVLAGACGVAVVAPRSARAGVVARGAGLVRARDVAEVGGVVAGLGLLLALAVLPWWCTWIGVR